MTSGAYGSTTGTRERESRPLMDQLMVFSLSDEIEALRNEPQWADNEVNSRTLAKDIDFRVMLTVMHAEALIDEHNGDARASLQLLEGTAMVEVDEVPTELIVGKLAVVDAGRPWVLRATSDCAVLLTLAWPIDKAGV